MQKRPVALVTGANRGLGLETCRQLRELDFDAVLAARDPDDAAAAAAESVCAPASWT